MADPTDSLDVVNEAIRALLIQNKSTLGLTDVWYGEHQTIPNTPSVTVDPRSRRRELQSTGHTVRNYFGVFVTLFHSRLTGGSVMMKECLQLAEAVEAVIHADRKLGGLLTHSYVTQIDTGFTTRNKVILKAAQLQWSGHSTTRLLP